MSRPRVTVVNVVDAAGADPELRVFSADGYSQRFVTVTVGPVSLFFADMDEVEGWARLLLRQCADERRRGPEPLTQEVESWPIW